MSALDPSDPSVWGPPLWLVLHIMVEHYPMRPSMVVKRQGYHFFHSLGYMLPCHTCRGHYQHYIDKHDKELHVALESRDTLAAFLIALHNNVNSRLSKEEWNMDVHVIRAKYQDVALLHDCKYPLLQAPPSSGEVPVTAGASSTPTGTAPADDNVSPITEDATSNVGSDDDSKAQDKCFIPSRTTQKFKCSKYIASVGAGVAVGLVMWTIFKSCRARNNMTGTRSL
jgi:hypothetical protein